MNDCEVSESTEDILEGKRFGLLKVGVYTFVSVLTPIFIYFEVWVLVYFYLLLKLFYLDLFFLLNCRGTLNSLFDFVVLF